jgi:Ca2+-binding RTX toxin-like protein
MQVKIGDRIYDGNDEPVMVILSDKDKENIANMLPEYDKYCAYPQEMSQEEILVWMGDEENDTITGGSGNDSVFGGSGELI